MYVYQLYTEFDSALLLHDPLGNECKKENNTASTTKLNPTNNEKNLKLKRPFHVCCEASKKKSRGIQCTKSPKPFDVV